MKTICKDEYLEKVEHLTPEETERLLSRMHGKLPRRLEKGKLSQQEALAIQMELEDEQLQEWREMVKMLKKTTKSDKAKGADKPAKEAD